MSALPPDDLVFPGRTGRRNDTALPRADLPRFTPRPAPVSTEDVQAVDDVRAPDGTADRSDVRAHLRLVAGGGLRVLRRAASLRPDRQRLTVVRDLYVAGGARAVSRRLSEALRAPVVSRSDVVAPMYDGTVTLAAVPWPADLPLVSIIVANYNYGRYLEECLQSVARQTVRSLEVVVVDSASDDPGSVAALRRLQEAPPVPFRVVERPERHLLGCNRNAGWQVARGRYVCFLDPDDRLAPTYLEACLFHLEGQGYDVVGTGVQYFEGSQGSWGDMPVTATLSDALERCPTSSPALVRRDLLAAAEGFHDTGLGGRLVFEDWKLWVRALALGARLRNVPARLLDVRVHAAGQSRHLDIPGMDLQRSAIAAYNQDVVTRTAVQRSARLARTRYRVEGAWEHLRRTPSSAADVLLVVEDLETAGDPAVLAAVGQWRAAGTRVTVVAVRAAERSASRWPAACGLETDAVHVLSQQLPVEEWLEYCRYLVATRGVEQVWRLVRRRPRGFLQELPVQLPEVLVLDVVASDFEQDIIV